LQKLKIIPKDQSYIDLTLSPPTSPRIKHEPGTNGVKNEDTKNTATDVKIKREPEGTHSNAQTPIIPEQASARPTPIIGSPNSLGPAHDERNKKRKALQNGLEALELQQKRLRIGQELADLDNED